MRVCSARCLARSLLLFLVAGHAHASISLCDRVGSDLRSLRSAVRLYQITHDGLLPHDLNALVTSGALEPRVPADPWGSPYALIAHGDDFELVTMGPDRLANTDDDFSTASSHCPPWPAPDSNRKAVLIGILATFLVAVGLLGRNIVGRRHPAKPARTTLN